MIPRDSLPEDAADWRGIAVTLPPLANGLESSCPREPDVFEYIQMESGDYDQADRSRLRFERTAQGGDARYWLWTYRESDGQVCFITCRADSDGATCLSLAEPNGLNQEQFLLADYYGEIYWS
jgi:hypothetical protein